MYNYVDDEPLVSIVITTHNRSQLLKRAINSAINQDYRNKEIIVVDDGSTDETELVVNKFLSQNTNLKYYRHQKPLGANASRNTGIKKSEGIFVMGLDDDDEFFPNRISTLLSHYEDKYSLITSRSIQVGSNYSKTTKFVPTIDLNTMLYFNAIGNQVLIRKDRIINAGLFDENLLRYQDYDMWLRIIKMYGNAKMVKEITQKVYYNHSTIIDNTWYKNFLGSYGFYLKHKKSMNQYQRLVHLNKIKVLQGKKLSLLNALKIKFLINMHLFHSKLNQKLRKA